MNTPIPTPRTDANAGCLIDSEEVVPADFARKLERELARLRAEVERLRHLEALLNQAAAEVTAHTFTAGGIAGLRAEASLHALRPVCGTTDADKFTTWVERANARAERAEAELDQVACARTDGILRESDLQCRLNMERARLDWLEKRGPWDSWNDAGETGITLRENIRAAIDAAMKEGAT